jgi:hypothetical protein
MISIRLRNFTVLYPKRSSSWIITLFTRTCHWALSSTRKIESISAQAVCFRNNSIQISGFRRDAGEICDLRHYAASRGICLPTFRDSVSVRCPETTVNNYQKTPRNIPDQPRSHLNPGFRARFLDYNFIVFTYPRPRNVILVE